MKIRYVGMRDEAWSRDPRRGAEIESRYDDDDRYNDVRDNELFERVIKLLKIHGWKFTEGVPGWAFCEVEDRREYEDFYRDYKDCQRCIRNCMKYGF